MLEQFWKRRVLVLEDDSVLRETLHDTLADEGYEVATAADAHTAFRLAQKDKFHLFLTDVRMAGSMDGIGALDAIKGLQPSIRSIIMTGYADEAVPVQAMKLQADDYLLKGSSAFTMSGLLECVRRALEPRKFRFWSERLLLDEARNTAFQRLYVGIRSGHLNVHRAAAAWNRLAALDASYLGGQNPVYEGYLDGPPVSEPGEFRRIFRDILEGALDADAFGLLSLVLQSDEVARQNLESFLLLQRYRADGRSWSPQAAEPQTVDENFRVGKFRVVGSLRPDVHIVVSEVDESAPQATLLVDKPERQEGYRLLAQANLPEEHLLLDVHDGRLFYVFRSSARPAHPALLGAWIPGGRSLAEALLLLGPAMRNVHALHRLGFCDGFLNLRRFYRVGESVRMLTFALRHKRSDPALKFDMLFSAPEARSGAAVPASDQYGLALSLVELTSKLSNQFPLACADSLEQCEANIREICGENVPDPAPLARMLQPRPEARFPSVEEALVELSRSPLPPRCSG